MRVYVAGSSKELDRVAWNIKRLTDAGMDITHDWSKQVALANGKANPVTTESQRKKWSKDDYKGVATCDFLWLLLPSGHLSPGAFFEFGVAYALGVPVVISGDNMYSSIFTSLARARYTHDIQAFRYLSSQRKRTVTNARLYASRQEVKRKMTKMLGTATKIILEEHSRETALAKRAEKLRIKNE